jgi:hypothetical protein
MKYSLLFSLSIFISWTTQGQDFPTYLKQNAVKIIKPDSLSNDIYNLVSDYSLIMIGEMHGTNEPAEFVIGLTDLLTSKGDSVQVGMEIPSTKMKRYIEEHSDNSIYSSDFFKRSVDGRASDAWAQVISKVSKNHKASIFFYDVNDGDCSNVDDRDSMMYLKIKNKIQEHPSWKTITISGNIHNMLLPYKGKAKTAYFLINDQDLNLKDRICSLNHLYQRGSMINNSGNGLELKQVDNSDSDYSTAVDYDNYLFLMPINVTFGYSGIYFTKNVTAARMLDEK